MHDVPLLFETGIDRHMDLNVLITAPYEVRAQRVFARSGMPRDAFETRNAAQMPDDEKRARADVVLSNDTSPQDLQHAIDRIWRERIAPQRD